MAFISANPTHFDIKAILFHKNEKGKSSHKSIDVESFMKLINSDEYQEKMKDGKLLGLLTHSGRKTARENTNIPHADNVLIDPNLCNVLRGIDEDEECVYGYFDLVPNSSAAERFKTLIKIGSKIGVSISTELVETAEKFFIKKFHGVDFTLYPEFNSPVVQVNFSESEDNGRTHIVNWDSDIKMGNFSLRDYVREQQMSPHAILKSRMEEVIRFLRFHSNTRVSNEKWVLRSYIGSYIKTYINKAMNEGDLNIMITLRLDNYCSDRKAIRDLQTALRRAREQMKTNGYMTSDVQRAAEKAYSSLMAEVYDYINKKAKVQESDKAI